MFTVLAIIWSGQSEGGASCTRSKDSGKTQGSLSVHKSAVSAKKQVKKQKRKGKRSSMKKKQGQHLWKKVEPPDTGSGDSGIGTDIETNDNSTSEYNVETGLPNPCDEPVVVVPDEAPIEQGEQGMEPLPPAAVSNGRTQASNEEIRGRAIESS